MKWHFSPQLPEHVETEITQRDQFNNDEVDISETIVREAVQNSLDAAVDDPCRVKVSFVWLDKEKGLDPEFFESLFKGQIEHARKAEINIDKLDFSNPQALVIEDFGTCGLTGSVNQKDKENFSDFWRRHGKSHKTGKSRGRWGLGKLVYSTTSQLGAFFGITKRSSDPAIYLMGQTVLNLRTLDGREYPPHAFFADIENDADIYKRITVPIKDTGLIGDFVTNFSLQRAGHCGLSVVIPFPDPAFNVKSMISVAVGNYFYPLITGQLVLQFNEIEINSENIRQMARQYASDRFDQIDILFDFIEEIYQAEKGKLHNLKDSWIKDRKLDEDDFDAATLDSIREKYTRGELVGLYLPVSIREKNGTSSETGFSIYIKRPNDLKRGLDIYVRGGLTLPGEKKFRDRRALGAMIAEQEPICAFLGDAENAAHTQWTTNTEKLRRNYMNSQPLVTVIKKSVLQLYDLLDEMTEEIDEDALQDFFWFDEPETGNQKKRKKPKKPRPVPVIPPSKAKLKLTKISGGFTVSSTENLREEDLPKIIKIEVAYEVIRGSAYKKYSAHDFKVGRNGTIGLKANDAVKVVSARENKWVFELTKLVFQITATGFDENRDLKVKVS